MNTPIYGFIKVQMIGKKKRAAMWADPNWVNYTQESAKLGALESQQNKLLKPVDFYQFTPK